MHVGAKSSQRHPARKSTDLLLKVKSTELLAVYIFTSFLHALVWMDSGDGSSVGREGRDCEMSPKGPPLQCDCQGCGEAKTNIILCLA